MQSVIVLEELELIPLKKPQLDELEKNAILRVLSSGVIAQGPEVAAFESEFANFCNVKFAIAVNSGTAALHAALAACGVGPGDEVITTPFSFVATISPILMCGAKPVFVDIDAVTFNIDPRSIVEKITSKTKAIVGVDLFGLCADWTQLRKIAEQHKLVLIEDACQAHGATHAGINAGALGDVGAFSFYATKNMTTAEGGMLTTNNEEIAKFARRFRQHGMDTVGSYQYSHLGYNYRTTDICAAIGREQLKKLPGWNQRRIEIAHMLTEGLKSVRGLVTPQVPDGSDHVYHLYTLLVDQEIRDRLVAGIRSNGVGSGVYYPQPLYRSGILPKSEEAQNLPICESVCRRVISIPCEPFMTDSDVTAVINAVTQSFYDIV